jgi:hypothetical protein
MSCSYIDDPDISYYPPSLIRPRFFWPLGLYSPDATRKIPDGLDGLLDEIYQAVASDQHRLAVMGIRSLLEHMMIAEVGDHSRFAETLARFHSNGYISEKQKGFLETLLEAGHAVTHRSFIPNKDDVNTLLDIIEGLLEEIYIHTDNAETLATAYSSATPSSGKPSVTSW